MPCDAVNGCAGEQKRRVPRVLTHACCSAAVQTRGADFRPLTPFSVPPPLPLRAGLQELESWKVLVLGGPSGSRDFFFLPPAQSREVAVITPAGGGVCGSGGGTKPRETPSDIRGQ